MLKQTGIVASLYLDSEPEQVKYRLGRQGCLPAPAGIAVEARRRWGATKLMILTTDNEALAAFSKMLARPKFAQSFVGPWRIGYRQLDFVPGCELEISKKGTLIECFDQVDLGTALARAEYAAPTVFIVELGDGAVSEDQAIRLMRSIGEFTGNELYFTDEVKAIDLHLGEEESSLGMTYFREDKRLLITSEASGPLHRWITFTGVTAAFGEAGWRCFRAPVPDLHGPLEPPIERHEGFRAEEPLPLDRFLELFMEWES